MVDSNNAINNTVGASISGVTNTLTVTNPSDTASSAARAKITVGGTTSADPTLNFNIAGTADWEMGIDNDSADDLKISQGTSLGTNDTWIMNAAGERTMPLQPTFYATDSAAGVSVTGDGTVYTIIFDNVINNIGAGYDNITGIFTAPIDGIYLFVSSIIMLNIGASHVSGTMTFAVTGIANASIQPMEFNPANLRNGTEAQINGTHLVNMDATDTIKVTIQIGGGAKVINVGASVNSQFSGTLVH